MKLIIILLFLIFFKTFALKSSLNCDDLNYVDIKFLANHQVELIIDGPGRVENTDPSWENGYTMLNILNANDCLSKESGKYFDCSTIYQGQHNYTRADNYDPKKFPSPGDTIGFAVNVYAHCFNYCETTCLKSCLYTGGISYDPPN
ncbi:hypothetical protein C1646_753091 [Rhizophagus diaphanus]|nr:hypothetical protein C1646_753091 [Rhizophagus diaphanus] [Rhizophagus sp. MUCL 43196]